jgi:hypothetical protein
MLRRTNSRRAASRVGPRRRARTRTPLPTRVPPPPLLRCHSLDMHSDCNAACCCLGFGDTLRALGLAAMRAHAPHLLRLACLAAAACGWASVSRNGGARSARGVASALDNGLARTPPLGWSSWNRFGCRIDERLIRETADAFVSRGLRDAGCAPCDALLRSRIRVSHALLLR